MLNKFLDASKAFGQTISLSKTEVLYQPALNTTPVGPNISIDDTPLANVDSFNYLVILSHIPSQCFFLYVLVP